MRGSKEILGRHLHIGLGFVKLRILSIDCTAVENEAAKNMYQRSELDWLIYNDPLAYAELILNGELSKYLKNITIHKSAID